ncbi:aldo-keto reductase Mvan_2161-like [Ciona intestinalis]
MMLLTKLLLLVVYLTYVICEEDPIINDAKAGQPAEEEADIDNGDSQSENIDTTVYEEDPIINDNKIPEPDDIVGEGGESVTVETSPDTAEQTDDQTKDEPMTISEEQNPENENNEETNEDNTSSSSSADTNAYIIPNVTLKSGHKMPLLGLGVYRLGKATYRITKEALEIGYRLIDTAKNYEASRRESSEVAVGKAIVASGVPRSEIFLTTKIMPDFFRMKEMRKAVKECLKNLQTDYLDLLLVHYPDCAGDPYCRATGTLLEGWNNMAVLVDEGLVRDIGVSNAFIEEIEKLWVEGEKQVSVLQNWFDPYYQDHGTRDIASKNGMVFTGYSTLGLGWIDDGMKKNPVLTDSTIKQIADRRNCAPSDVVLKWAVTRGVAVIPGTTNSEHLRMNYNSLKVELTEEDLMLMDGLNNKLKPLIDYGSQASPGGFLGVGNIVSGLVNFGKSLVGKLGFGGSSSSGIVGGEL